MPRYELVETVRLVVEALVVLNLLPSQVREVLVPTAPVPLPKRMSLAVKAWAPVPPLATGRVPETSEVKDTWPMLSSPEIALTTPEPREDRVVEPK